MKVNDERVTLNVSGDIFETRKTTLRRFPGTLLGDEYRMLNFYCTKTQTYFMNRNRRAFEAILYFYQSDGDLRLPPDLRMEIFIQECIFYGIPKVYIDSMRLKAGVLSKTIERGRKEAKPIIESKTCRAKIWNFLENPETSQYAKAFAVFSFINITLSVLLACIDTVAALKSTNPFWSNPFELGELYLNSWFLFEFLLRFLFCPKKYIFMRKWLNWVDLIAVVPYFIFLIINRGGTSSIGVLKLLRFVRVLRLFRLSKHSARIKEVGDILSDSFQDLYIFVLCLFIMTVFSGAILYFAELSHPYTQFTSIPESMWWALQTVVTLGYGDITPVTIVGRVYSAFFMVFGALTIALPVLSIVMKFTHMYSMDPEEEDQTVTPVKGNTGAIRKVSGSIRERSATSS
ncbi:potassium voltage-gated channel subfamily A member 10-like isoform X2 [Clytia hemisphaerica]